MSKQKPNSAKKAGLSRRPNRTLKRKPKSNAPVAPTAAAQRKATENRGAHVRASGLLPVMPTHAISAESLDVIPYLTEEDIAAANGELSPREMQAIEEILRQPNTVELPTTTARRKRGKPGPAYDIVDEGDEKLVDYGPYLLKQEANGDVSFRRTDGKAVYQGISIVGSDSAEVATIREALRVYRDSNESAAGRATALELLRVWSFLERAKKSWSETRYYKYADAYVTLPSNEEPHLSGVLTDGSKALFPIELLTKLGKWCGTLIERFRRHPDDGLVLKGKRHGKGASEGGAAKKKKNELHLWRDRLRLVQEAVKKPGGDMRQIVLVIAEKELERDVSGKPKTVRRTVRRADHIMEQLLKRYPVELAACRAACSSIKSS